MAEGRKLGKGRVNENSQLRSRTIDFMQLISKTSKPPLFFVINGGSGRASQDATLDTIETAMRQVGRTYRVFTFDNGNDLKPTIQKAVDAASEEAGVVVAVGGDGTINAVASAALFAGCTFGAIPRGTFNYFGRTHGIPEEIDAALEDLLDGEPVPAQVGWVNDRVFLVNASVGLYPVLLEDREQFKQRYGRSRLVALWSAVVTAFGHHRYLDVVMQEEGKQVNLRTTTLFVGNNRLQLEQVGMPQAESLHHGRLAGIAVKPVRTLALLWLAVRGALGKLADAENVTGFSFRSLRVVPLGIWRGRGSAGGKQYVAASESARRNRIKVAIDGEICWLRAPLEFSVGDKPLMLIKRSAARRETEVGAQ